MAVQKRGALATGTIALGSAKMDGKAASWLVSIKSASSLSLTFKGWPDDDSNFTTSDGVVLAYRDLSTTTDASGATAITANGNYRIASDGLNVDIVVTAGTGTYSATPINA